MFQCPGTRRSILFCYLLQSPALYISVSSLDVFCGLPLVCDWKVSRAGLWRTLEIEIRIGEMYRGTLELTGCFDVPRYAGTDWLFRRGNVYLKAETESVGGTKGSH